MQKRSIDIAHLQSVISALKNAPNRLDLCAAPNGIFKKKLSNWNQSRFGGGGGRGCPTHPSLRLGLESRLGLGLSFGLWRGVGGWFASNLD